MLFSSSLLHECSRIVLLTFNEHLNHPQILAKIQILTQEAWGGARDSAFGPHFE